jgi:hypothetical protein
MSLSIPDQSYACSCSKGIYRVINATVSDKLFPPVGLTGKFYFEARCYGKVEGKNLLLITTLTGFMERE